MGNKTKERSIEDHRALAMYWCHRIWEGSNRLSTSEIEEKLSVRRTPTSNKMGAAADSNGRKTGKTFQRYLDGRMPYDNALQAMVISAQELGWLPKSGLVSSAESAVASRSEKLLSTYLTERKKEQELLKSKKKQAVDAIRLFAEALADAKQMINVRLNVDPETNDNELYPGDLTKMAADLEAVHFFFPEGGVAPPLDDEIRRYLAARNLDPTLEKQPKKATKAGAKKVQSRPKNEKRSR